MENHFYKSTGISLISGAFLIITTMVLHPAGGSIEYIIKISKKITMALSLGILSLPIILFGLYGLSVSLLDKWRLSMLALVIALFGLIAAMFAAMVNGLTLPYFLGQYAERLDENIAVLKPITNYGFALNTPLDYIFIVACCLSIMIYSIIILFGKKFPKWIGYLGVFIISFSVIGGLTGFIFTSLMGFRVITFSIAAWIISSGVSLFKSGL